MFTSWLPGTNDVRARKLGVVSKQVDELGPFRARPRIGNVARHQDSIQGTRCVYRGELAQRAPYAPVASRAVRSRLHAAAVALADEVQVRQMSHSIGRRRRLQRARRPVKYPAAESEFTPDPIEALGGSGHAEDHRRIA